MGKKTEQGGEVKQARKGLGEGIVRGGGNGVRATPIYGEKRDCVREKGGCGGGGAGGCKRRKRMVIGGGEVMTTKI